MYFKSEKGYFSPAVMVKVEKVKVYIIKGGCVQILYLIFIENLLLNNFILLVRNLYFENDLKPLKLLHFFAID